MNKCLYISKKYLRGTHSNLAGNYWLSLLGIIIGVASLLVIISVMNGMNEVVLSRLLSSTPEIQATSSNQIEQSVIDSISNEKFVKFATLSKEESLLILGTQQTSLASIRAVDLDQMLEHSPLFSTISDNDDSYCGLLSSPNTIEKFKDDGVIVGREFFLNNNLVVGLKIQLMSLHKQTTTSFGLAPLTQTFTISGVYSNSISEIENSVFFTDKNNIDKFLNDNNSNTKLDIYINSHISAKQKKSELAKKYPNLVFEDWREQNSNLFDAMQLEKLIMKFVLSLIILLSSFNLSGSFLKKVANKKKELGILVTIGYSKMDIVKIFLYQGIIIGFLGVIAGNIIAYGLLTLQLKYGLVSLPPNLSFLFTSLPIKMKMSDFISISLFSLIFTIISSFLPTLKINKLNPIEIIRD